MKENIPYQLYLAGLESNAAMYHDCLRRSAAAEEIASVQQPLQPAAATLDCTLMWNICYQLTADCFTGQQQTGTHQQQLHRLHEILARHHFTAAPPGQEDAGECDCIPCQHQGLAPLNPGA